MKTPCGEYLINHLGWYMIQKLDTRETFFIDLSFLGEFKKKQAELDEENGDDKKKPEPPVSSPPAPPGRCSTCGGPLDASGGPLDV